MKMEIFKSFQLLFADLVITPTVLGDSYAPSDLRQTKDISLYPSGTSSVLGMHRRQPALRSYIDKFD